MPADLTQFRTLRSPGYYDTSVNHSLDYQPSFHDYISAKASESWYDTSYTVAGRASELLFSDLSKKQQEDFYDFNIDIDESGNLPELYGGDKRFEAVENKILNEEEVMNLKYRKKSYKDLGLVFEKGHRQNYHNVIMKRKYNEIKRRRDIDLRPNDLGEIAIGLAVSMGVQAVDFINYIPVLGWSKAVTNPAGKSLMKSIMKSGFEAGVGNIFLELAIHLGPDDQRNYTIIDSAMNIAMGIGIGTGFGGLARGINIFGEKRAKRFENEALARRDRLKLIEEEAKDLDEQTEINYQLFMHDRKSEFKAQAEAYDNLIKGNQQEADITVGKRLNGIPAEELLSGIFRDIRKSKQRKRVVDELIVSKEIKTKEMIALFKTWDSMAAVLERDGHVKSAGEFYGKFFSGEKQKMAEAKRGKVSRYEYYNEKNEPYRFKDLKSELDKQVEVRKELRNVENDFKESIKEVQQVENDYLVRIKEEYPDLKDLSELKNKDFINFIKVTNERLRFEVEVKRFDVDHIVSEYDTMFKQYIFKYNFPVMWKEKYGNLKIEVDDFGGVGNSIKDRLNSALLHFSRLKESTEKFLYSAEKKAGKTGDKTAILKLKETIEVIDSFVKDGKLKQKELFHYYDKYKTKPKFEDSFTTKKDISDNIEIGKGVSEVIKTGNLQQVLHETGQIFGKIVDKFDKVDYNTLGKYAEVDEKTLAKGWDSWSPNQKKKIGDAFETYIIKGDSPSTRLKEVFERFKGWLTEIYRGMKIGGEKSLDIEVGKVFDKWLHTKAEIRNRPNQPIKTFAPDDSIPVRSVDDPNLDKRLDDGLEELYLHATEIDRIYKKGGFTEVEYNIIKREADETYFNIKTDYETITKLEKCI